MKLAFQRQEWSDSSFDLRSSRELCEKDLSRDNLSRLWRAAFANYLVGPDSQSNAASAFRRHRDLSLNLPTEELGGGPGHEYGNGLYVEAFLLLYEGGENASAIVDERIEEVDLCFRRESEKASPYFPPNIKLAHLFALTSLNHFSKRELFEAKAFLACSRRLIARAGVLAEFGGGLEPYRVLSSEIWKDSQKPSELLFSNRADDWDHLVANDAEFRHADGLSKEILEEKSIPRVYQITQRAKRLKYMPRRTSKRDKIFVSYSHEDEAWLLRLREMLAPYEDEGLLLWDDTKIRSGQKWREEISKSLSSAKVAVLLVSSHFRASRFIRENELPPLLNAAEREGVTILWAYVGYCALKGSPLLAYQAMHDIEVPLEALSSAEQNKMLLNFALQIIEAFEK